MDGLMQEPALTLALVLRRLETVGREVTVSSAGPDGVARHTWGQIGERARRLAGALDALAVPRRGRVATLAWNSHRHLEVFYAVPCSDRVLHTLNARLRPEDLIEMARRTGDDVLFVDASLTPLLVEHAGRLPFREIVVMDDGAEPAAPFADRPRYEELLAAAEPLWDLPEPDERAAVCVCHTTGTTGRPKGVVYSHRSVVLHALGALATDAHGVSRGEVALPLTPMFHLMGWGMPYSTALAPCPLVLAGADASPGAIAALVESERATLVAGVPTFLVRLAAELSGERDLSSLRRVLAGGAAAPPRLVERYLEAGIEFVPTWGMTEAGSGTGGALRPGADLGAGIGQGVPIAGVELRIVGEDGAELPWDDTSVGELEARGLWIAASYLDADDDTGAAAFDDGWLRTGDLARIGADGAVGIVDRVKDLIKSGGEWISSAEIEARLCAGPGVAEAAVIAIADPEWGERPLALVIAEPGADPDPVALRAELAVAIPRWWLPERIEIVTDLPRTSVGKLDKARLRREHTT
ncbi:MAG TPA: AMP-binding protein [Solirubrobacterales bacterium]|nr:AMP-binding protein [Solirubrobacterales bacterium]